MNRNKSRPFEVSTTDLSVKATRQLAPGELIMMELPVIWAPRATAPLMCLGCAKILNDDHRNCSKCGWAVCANDFCEKSPSHLAECGYSARINGLKNNRMYKSIILLRFLYQRQISNLENFESKWELNKHKFEFKNDRWAIAQLTRRFFRLFFLPIEELIKIHEIITMSFLKPTDDTIALYLTASLLEHHCTPNCTQSFNKNGAIEIKACVDIQEGDTLYISKTNSLAGTPHRRDSLYKEYSFWCCCTRCQDPSEFGTNFSALKCQSLNCKGVILPKSFLKPLEGCWRCDVCGTVCMSSLAMEILEHIQGDLDEGNFDDFLRLYEVYLHENSYVWVRLRQRGFPMESPHNLIQILAPNCNKT